MDCQLYPHYLHCRVSSRRNFTPNYRRPFSCVYCHRNVFIGLDARFDCPAFSVGYMSLINVFTNRRWRLYWCLATTAPKETSLRNFFVIWISQVDYTNAYKMHAWRLPVMLAVSSEIHRILFRSFRNIF